MPSQILHTLFGEDLCAEISRRLAPRFGDAAKRLPSAILAAHKGAFALGCQGPDIFYHSRGSRPLGLEYGTLLHRRSIGNFAAELLKEGLPAFSPDSGGARKKLFPGGKRPGILSAYALGFMSHAALDRASHPYIVYKSGWFTPSRPETFRFERAHPFFERILDALMLKRLRGMEAAEWDQEALLARTCKNPPRGLKKLLARSLRAVFPERAGKDMKLNARINNTLTDCAFFYRVTSPARTSSGAPARGGFAPALTRVKRPARRLYPSEKRQLAYLFPERLASGIDFLNLNRGPWHHPAGERGEDTRSFPDIYAEALAAAADSLGGIIGRYLEEGIFPAEDAALAVGNGGLSIADEAGKPCAPVLSDPLPLDEVLEAEAARRGIFA